MGSRRSVGHSWEQLKPRDVPTLFGGGGYHDEGQTVMINTGGENIQREEFMTIQDGNGERALDVPGEQRDVESYANANDEFHYSQFKSGGGDMGDAEHRVQLTTVRDGPSAGDYLMKVDPRSDVYDQTISALGSIH
jgi:hypothetical protein